MIDDQERKHGTPEPSEMDAAFDAFWASLIIAPTGKHVAKKCFLAGFRSARGEDPIPEVKPAPRYPQAPLCQHHYHSKLQPDGYRCNRRREDHRHVEHSFEAPL